MCGVAAAVARNFHVPRESIFRAINFQRCLHKTLHARARPCALMNAATPHHAQVVCQRRHSRCVCVLECVCECVDACTRECVSACVCACLHQIRNTTLESAPHKISSVCAFVHVCVCVCVTE